MQAEPVNTIEENIKGNNKNINPNPKSEKNSKEEKAEDEYNLAYIPLDLVEDKRSFKYEEDKKGAGKYTLDENLNYDGFIRGIIYGTQVVLRKVFVLEDVEKDNKRKKVIHNLMNIDELEDDLSVSLIHGICFESDIENNSNDKKPVFIVREWVKGKNFWEFRDYMEKKKKKRIDQRIKNGYYDDNEKSNNEKEQDSIGKSDLLSILYSLAKIIDHYHKYTLSYVFLRPKKVIVLSDFNVVLNDIIKLNSYLFDEKISNQIKNINKLEHQYQNRFLHPLLFYMAKNDKKLEAQMFWLYQIFDLYSFGCLCYYFYFSLGNKRIPWENKNFDDIFDQFYLINIDDEIKYNSKDNYYKLLNGEDSRHKERNNNLMKSFFGENEIEEKKEEKNNYDSQLKEIIMKCLNPRFVPKNNNNYEFEYTMKNAVEDFLQIDCVKKFNKTKEFDYDFQEGNL